jgi:hypothetical protein
VPVTPFHFGPGILSKGLFPARFSAASFVLAQILIDVERARLQLAAADAIMSRRG